MSSPFNFLVLVLHLLLVFALLLPLLVLLLLVLLLVLPRLLVSRLFYVVIVLHNASKIKEDSH